MVDEKENNMMKEGQEKEMEIVPIGEKGGELIVPVDNAVEIAKLLGGPVGEKIFTEFDKLPVEEKKDWLSWGLGSVTGAIALRKPRETVKPEGAIIGAIIGLILSRFGSGKIKLERPEIDVLNKVKDLATGAKVILNSEEAKIFVELLTKLQEKWESEQN
jgi:hypothetical protein